MDDWMLLKCFARKVRITDTCWIWEPAEGKSYRYGNFGYDGKQVLAHRVSWIMFVGPIPDGLCVLHTCDNPLCVNPKHLWLGTDMDNSRDRDAKGRGAHGERSPWAKLTDAAVAEIIKAVARNEPQQVIAARFGVKQPTISSIVTGRRWKHIKRQDELGGVLASMCHAVSVKGKH